MSAREKAGTLQKGSAFDPRPLPPPPPTAVFGAILAQKQNEAERNGTPNERLTLCALTFEAPATCLCRSNRGDPAPPPPPPHRVVKKDQALAPSFGGMPTPPGCPPPPPPPSRDPLGAGLFSIITDPVRLRGACYIRRRVMRCSEAHVA